MTLLRKRLARGRCFGGISRMPPLPLCFAKSLNGEIFYSLKEAQIVIEQWRVEYNTRRPHSALGYSPLVPANPISLPEAVM